MLSEAALAGLPGAPFGCQPAQTANGAPYVAVCAAFAAFDPPYQASVYFPLPRPRCGRGDVREHRACTARTSLMPWMPLTEPMGRLLDSMTGTPAAQRKGTIDGVMIKTFRKWADQRGYFIEQLKQGDLDDQGRPFIPDHPFAQMSRSLAYARGGNPPELIKAFHWHR